ncbi:MAG TPA: hypothetical protein VKR58_01085 [Aquella sp.]|nr:hypothetical protein [Aquella sp.]
MTKRSIAHFIVCDCGIIIKDNRYESHLLTKNHDKRINRTSTLGRRKKNIN